MQDIFRKLLRALPFRPFRVTTKAGDCYDVRCSSLAGMTRSRLFVTLLTPAGRLAPSATQVPFAEIARVELIDLAESLDAAGGPTTS